MSFNLIGALVGLSFAVVEYFVFGMVIGRSARRGEAGSGPRALNFVRKAQLVAFPVIGWFIGPLFADAMGASQ